MNLPGIAGKPLLCPLCRSSNLKRVFQDLLKCKDCGIRFVKFKEDALNFDQIYNEDYFQGKVYRDYPQEESFRIRLFTEKLQLLQKYLPESGRVLDIGCAMGFFLKVIQERDYEPYGVEISKYASGHARRNYKLNIYQGDFLSAHFPDEFFDLITMWDVLEHLINPLDILAEINRVSKKDGILIIETLNIDSMAARILRQNWPLYLPPYHLFYYSVKTLKRVLDKMGFVLIKILPIQTYIWTLKGFRSFRYFKKPLIRRIAGNILNDVILCLAMKS